MNTANDGLGTSPRPILVTAWPVARMKAAPSGSEIAHSGQLRLTPCGFQAATTAPAMTAIVPTAIGQVSFSSSTRMAQNAPKIGDDAVSADESVGPMCLDAGHGQRRGERGADDADKCEQQAGEGQPVPALHEERRKYPVDDRRGRDRDERAGARRPSRRAPCSKDGSKARTGTPSRAHRAAPDRESRS